MDHDRPKFERFFIADVDEFAFLLYAAVNAQLDLLGVPATLSGCTISSTMVRQSGAVEELSMEVVSELTFYCCCYY